MKNKLQIFQRKAGLFQYRAQRALGQVACVHWHGYAPLVAFAKKYPMASFLASEDKSASLQGRAHDASGYGAHGLLDRYFNSAEEGSVGLRNLFVACGKVFQIQFDCFTCHLTRFFHFRAIGDAPGKRRHCYGIAAFQIRLEYQLKCLFSHVASVARGKLLSMKRGQHHREFGTNRHRIIV